MKGKGILFTVLGIVLAIVLFIVASYVSASNYGVSAEQQIKAQYDDMQNILGQYSLKVAEAAQVPDMYKNDLKEIVTAAIQGRYGENGSQATIQFIQEQNPTVDSSVYTKIQQIIEAGRNQFQNAQTKFIDTKRSYETNLGFVWRGLWLRIAGFPKINLDDYKVISSDYAQKTFESGVSEPMKLR
jgi:Na+-transporting NADH:ubiquinone oxidoreductase subunit NqrC